MARKLKMTKACVAARKRYRAKKGGGVNWNRGRPMKTTYFRRNRQGKRRAVKAPAGWPGS